MEQNKFDAIIETIGYLVDETLIADDPENDEDRANISLFLGLVQESYVIVTWPESQELMEEDWFEDEAILDVDAKFGSSAYFIPLKRLL